MNILTMNGLPEEYEGIPISPDFRNMIQVDAILSDTGLNDTEKTVAALMQLYPTIPGDTEKALAGLQWFFMRGASGGGKAGKPAKKPFDFEQDANIIYAAFYATYNISLSTVGFLHWWEFMALFEGLPETTLMQRIIYWRTADLASLPKAERKHVAKMRKTFALNEPNKEQLSVEQLEQQTKDQIARRFEQAQRWAQEKGGANHAHT